jgi:hypothetical protein
MAAVAKPPTPSSAEGSPNTTTAPPTDEGTIAVADLYRFCKNKELVTDRPAWFPSEWKCMPLIIPHCNAASGAVCVIFVARLFTDKTYSVTAIMPNERADTFWTFDDINDAKEGPPPFLKLLRGVSGTCGWSAKLTVVGGGLTVAVEHEDAPAEETVFKFQRGTAENVVDGFDAVTRCIRQIGGDLLLTLKKPTSSKPNAVDIKSGGGGSAGAISVSDLYRVRCGKLLAEEYSATFPFVHQPILIDMKSAGRTVLQFIGWFYTDNSFEIEALLPADGAHFVYESSRDPKMKVTGLRMFMKAVNDGALQVEPLPRDLSQIQMSVSNPEIGLTLRFTFIRSKSAVAAGEAQARSGKVKLILQTPPKIGEGAPSAAADSKKKKEKDDDGDDKDALKAFVAAAMLGRALGCGNVHVFSG